MRCFHIEARDIPDAWFQSVDLCYKEGRDYKVGEGSYAGSQFRRELDYVTIHIKYPQTRPLLPEIPPGLGIPDPVPEGMDYITRYLPYLMTDKKEPEESYTYGERLWRPQQKIDFFKTGGSDICPGTSMLVHPPISQVEEVIEKFKRGFNNNQACMTIAQPSDIHLSDPPCLRSIDCRIYSQTEDNLPDEEKLHFVIKFRCLSVNQPVFFQDDEGKHFSSIDQLYKSFTEGFGPEVISISSDRKIKFAKIIDAKKRYTEDIFGIRTYDGSRIEVTPEHRVLVLNEEDEIVQKQARNLKENDKLLRVASFANTISHGTLDKINILDTLKNSSREYYLREVPLSLIKEIHQCKPSWRDRRVIPLSKAPNREIMDKYGYKPKIGAARSSSNWEKIIYLNKQWGYLFGAWEANGWLRNNSLRIASGQEKVISELSKTLKTLKINFTKETRGKCIVFNIHEVLIRDLLVNLGFIGGAHNKIVPQFVFSCTKEFKEGFFKGWWDGDSGCSVSRDLVDGMQIVATTLGYIASSYQEPPRIVTFPDGHTSRSSTCYKLYKRTGKRHKINKSTNLLFSKIKTIEKIFRCGFVADFTVNDTHNLAIGNGNILVHNSWDLWCGMPANLAALTYLQDYMAMQIGVDTGEFICSSKGVHIYSMYHSLAKARLGEK